VKFGLLRKKLQARMLTHPKLALCVLHILMHWNSGHVTSLLEEFHFNSLNFSFQSDVQHWVDSHLALRQNF